MSQRSDVSKLLAGRLSGGIRVSNLNRLGNAASLYANPLPEARTAHASPRGSASPKAGSSKAGSAVGSASGASHGFIIMKCLDVLKKAGHPLSLTEMQLQLSPECATAIANREVLARLSQNARISFDPATKLWSFVSPYRFLTSPEALLEHLKQKGSFEINSEALAFDKEVASWINKLLANRALRAVRAVKSSRCKVYSAESGLFCDLYVPSERCESCKTLAGVILYPHGPEAFESLAIDRDLKELWHSLPPTPAAETTIMAQRANTNTAGGRGKRRRPAGTTRGPKIMKVANVHLYNTTELNEELLRQQEQQREADARRSEAT